MSPIYDLWAAIRDVKFKDSIQYYRPLVSVVIPAWNEEVGILSTLRSVLASEYAPLEIVVINDGSTDGSDKLIREFISAYRKDENKDSLKTIVYKYKKNGGKGRALNEGIKLSNGDIIVSIDADCIVAPNAITNFVKPFADPTVMAAVGNVKIGNTKSLIGTIQYLEFLFSFYFKKADSILNTIYIIGGAAGAFRREVFNSIGHYSTHNITEDIELSVRIQAAGMKIVYASDAVIYTEGASDVKGLMKQRLRWKRGRFETFRDHKYLFFNRHKPVSGPNKLLTHAILPLALFGEIQLFFELSFVAILYVYSYLTNDFSSFISGIIVVSSMFVVQMFNDKEKKGLPFFLLAPIGWLLFYLSTFVEYNALIKSLWGFIKKQEVKWQSWQRSGVTDA